MIALRPMQDTMEDYLCMRDWFAEPDLQRWVWCDEKGEPPVPLERIVEKYGTRVKYPKDVFPYFILRSGKPIGFIQYYLHSADVIGLDMWIGISGERNQGHGTEALRQMVALIRRKHPEIRAVFIDPDVENKRAIRCYEKAGFHPDTLYTDEDGAICLLMKIQFDKEASP